MPFRLLQRDPNAYDLEDGGDLTLDDVHKRAQERADAMGHVCTVWGVDGRMAFQAAPTPKPAPAEPGGTLLGGLADWLKRNVQDPDED